MSARARRPAGETKVKAEPKAKAGVHPEAGAKESLHPEAGALIEALDLAPHPEGGFYRESYRSATTVPRGVGGSRPASTAIYFLLPAGACSVFHRLRSEEVWHHYAGDPLELHMLDADGAHHAARLGSEIASGESPQLAVPAGVWQAARVLGKRYALCGCTVAPGFEFEDFELAKREELLARYPEHRALIESLTRA